MKIVVAPDSWKDCLPAHRVADAMRTGIVATGVEANVVCKPMADGGQGTVEAMVRATGGRFVEREVCGPLRDMVVARFGILGDGRTAVVEMAAAAGLELVPVAQRNPLLTTTRGVGELLLAAAKSGVQRIVLGIGGSATNDGGAGMLAALGFRLLNAEGNDIEPNGGGLERLDRIDASTRIPILDRISIDVACDVTNPLCGPTGASAVFGPQKGADAETVKTLDRNLAKFAAIALRDLGKSIADVPGSGAAGGLGGGLLAGTNATLGRGVAMIADAVGLQEELRDADLCMTGEGSFDSQSSFGKTAVGVARICKGVGVPCVVVAGAVHPPLEALHAEGVTAYFSAMKRAATLDESVRFAPQWIADTTGQAVRLFAASKTGSCVP